MDRNQKQLTRTQETLSLTRDRSDLPSEPDPVTSRHVDGFKENIFMLSLRHLLTTVLSAGLIVLPAEVSLQTGLPQSFSAQAQPTPLSTSAEAAIGRVFTSKQLQPNWFSSSFFQRVPPSQFQQIVNSIRSLMGSYRGVQREGSRYLIAFERGSLPTTVALNSSGQISRMGFGCPRSTSIQLSQVPKQFRQQLSKCPGFQSNSLPGRAGEQVSR